MRRISSKATFYYKRVFPAFWFGLLLIIVTAGLLGAWGTGQWPHPMVLLVPVFMGVFGYVIMHKLIFDLVDEVYDVGEALVVRNGGEEETIALSNIMNVSSSHMVNPPRVTLSLRHPSRFGSEVTFCGPIRIVPFSKDPNVEELIRRIDARRGK